jgi:hypothetical protein
MILRLQVESIVFEFREYPTLKTLQPSCLYPKVGVKVVPCPKSHPVTAVTLAWAIRITGAGITL